MGLIDGFWDYVSKVGSVKLIVVALAIGFQFYFVQITSAVPNFNEATRTLYYGASDLVIPNSITFTHAVFSSALILGIWWFSKEVDKDKIIDHHQARQIVLTDLGGLSKKDQRFIGAKTETFDFTLRRTFNEATPTPNRYIFFSHIFPSTEAGGDPPFWYRFEVNPYTGNIERRFETKSNLTPQMLCSSCGEGNTADYKIITSQNLSEYAEIKKALGEKIMGG